MKYITENRYLFIEMGYLLIVILISIVIKLLKKRLEGKWITDC